MLPVRDDLSSTAAPHIVALCHKLRGKDLSFRIALIFVIGLKKHLADINSNNNKV